MAMNPKNVVCLTGNLGKDIEIRYTPQQKAVASFSLAIARYVKNGDNTTDWINVVAFGSQAEYLEKYACKGSTIQVAGSLKSGSYEKDGRTVYTLDVLADAVTVVNSKQREKAETTHFSNDASEKYDIPEGFSNLDADDMPF